MKRLIRRITWLQWFLIGAAFILVAGAAGLVLGYWTGAGKREINQAISKAVDVQTQFELGMKDYGDGNYNLARQRFEYVLQQNPDFPRATEMLSETLLRLAESGVEISTIEPPTATPSPTPDTRPVEELFSAAQGHLTNQEWRTLVQTILALRDIDPGYRASEVDRMLYLALRFSGIEKILDDGDLEGGLYDLALVERFVLLDKQAEIYRGWARLYQIGMSFWGVLPDQSVYYFSQLAGAAPYLRDLSGIYASDRYRMALYQYGDQLAQAGEWCLALDQYNLVQSLGEDPGLMPTVTYLEDACQYSIATPQPTSPPVIVLTATPTLSVTMDLTVVFTLTPTPEITVTPSPTKPPGPPPTETPTVGVTEEPTLVPPTPTPTPTTEPSS